MIKSLAAFAVAGLAVAATGSPSAAAEPEAVRVAYFEEWPTANQAAQIEKWYDETLGVPVDWRPFDTGVEMAAAMVAGEIDIAYSMGAVPFALAVTDGAPIKVVGMAVDTGGADNCVIYKKEAIDRANAHELQGRKVAVPLNTVTHYKMLRSLDVLGVDVSQVDLVDMSPHDIDDAFIRGELAMGCSWGGPLRRMKGHGWELLSANEQDRLGIRAFDVIAVTERFAAAQPDLVVKFLEVTDRSIDYLDDEPDAAKALIAKAAGLERKRSDSVLSLFDFHTKEDQLTERWMGGGIQTYLKEVAGFFQGQGEIAQALDDYSGSVDASFYERVQ